MTILPAIKLCKSYQESGKMILTNLGKIES